MKTLTGRAKMVMRLKVEGHGQGHGQLDNA